MMMRVSGKDGTTLWEGHGPPRGAGGLEMPVAPESVELKKIVEAAAAGADHQQPRALHVGWSTPLPDKRFRRAVP
eukprot:SAG31_NODE_6347_length_2053_cov_2.616172_2_plen_74_part_01